MPRLLSCSHATCHAPSLGAARWRAVVLACAVLVGGAGAASVQAQASGAAGAPALSSPLPPGSHGQPAVAGSGAGYHSPNSPIAPLPVRSDVVRWSVLTDLTKKTTANAVLPVFNAQQQGMHQTVQRIQGFIILNKMLGIEFPQRIIACGFGGIGQMLGQIRFELFIPAGGDIVADAVIQG